MEGLILGFVSLGIVYLMFTFGCTQYFILAFAHFFFLFPTGSKSAANLLGFRIYSRIECSIYIEREREREKVRACIIIVMMMVVVVNQLV